MPALLLIDDDADIREAICMVLTDNGQEVVAFENGGEALQYFETCEELPALVLLDLMMPAMTGWAFLQEKAKSRAAEVPVIVLTAASIDIARSQGVPSVRLVIHKPFDLERLLCAVECICSESKRT